VMTSFAHKSPVSLNGPWNNGEWVPEQWITGECTN
jgi:hypothetical protein